MHYELNGAWLRRELLNEHVFSNSAKHTFINFSFDTVINVLSFVSICDFWDTLYLCQTLQPQQMTPTPILLVSPHHLMNTLSAFSCGFGVQ